MANTIQSYYLPRNEACQTKKHTVADPRKRNRPASEAFRLQVDVPVESGPTLLHFQRRRLDHRRTVVNRTPEATNARDVGSGKAAAKL